MYDLVVIGGGPAGTSTAITAAAGGAQVLLLERGRFPRNKVCGEFVSAESLDLLSRLLGDAHRTLLQNSLRISCARLFIEDRIVRTEIDPSAASIARLDLDAALWCSAEARHIDARQQCAVLAISGDGPFFVTSEQGEFEAKAIVDASGRWSNLNASITGAAGERWIGLKAHFREVSPPESVDLYFRDGSYCGVQPLAPGDEGAVNVCAMVQANVARDLPEVFALHPALEKRSRSWKQLGDSVTTSPLIFRAPRPARGHVVQVGDAAGFVDPFVGDGISLALRTGALAAECLLPVSRGADLEEAVHRYSQIYERRFVGIFRTSSRVRRAFRMPRMLRRPAAALLERTPSLAQYLVGKTR